MGKIIGIGIILWNKKMKRIFYLLDLSAVLFYSQTDARLSFTQLLSRREPKSSKTGTKNSAVGWKCTDCYDSNHFVLSNGKEIVESEHKLPSNLNVNIKIDVNNNLNPSNSSEIVPVMHQGPRRVLLQRIDEQSKQLQDCTLSVRNLSTSAADFKKAYDECVIQSYTSQLQLKEEFDTKYKILLDAEYNLKLKNSQLSAEVVDSNVQLELYSFESKEFAKNMADLQLKLNRCKNESTKVVSSNQQQHLDLQRKFDSSEALLKDCNSQKSTSLSDNRLLTNSLAEADEKIQKCIADLAQCSLLREESNYQISELHRVRDKAANELTVLNSKTHRLEETLSSLQSCSPKAPPDNSPKLSRAALFLYSSLLLLIGYFVREMRSQPADRGPPGVQKTETDEPLLPARVNRIDGEPTLTHCNTV